MLQTTTRPKAKTVRTVGLSYEQFLHKYDGCHAEWINGKVIQYMSASTKHQRIVVWLTTLLNLFTEHYNLGLLLTAPANMYLEVVKHGREPDIMFVLQERLHIVAEQNLTAPADMVIEVVSPESAERDRNKKYGEYESAGITEYWLIDPLREEAIFYHLGIDGHYHPTPIIEGKLHSKLLPGFWLEVANLWQEPLPKVMQTVHKLGIQ